MLLHEQEQLLLISQVNEDKLKQRQVQIEQSRSQMSSTVTSVVDSSQSRNSRTLASMWSDDPQEGTSQNSGNCPVKFNVFLLPSLPCLLPSFPLLPLLLARWVACLPARPPACSLFVVFFLFFSGFSFACLLFFRLFFFMENVQNRSS